MSNKSAPRTYIGVLRKLAARADESSSFDVLHVVLMQDEEKIKVVSERGWMKAAGVSALFCEDLPLFERLLETCRENLQNSYYRDHYDYFRDRAFVVGNLEAVKMIRERFPFEGNQQPWFLASASNLSPELMRFIYETEGPATARQLLEKKIRHLHKSDADVLCKAVGIDLEAFYTQLNGTHVVNFSHMAYAERQGYRVPGYYQAETQRRYVGYYAMVDKWLKVARCYPILEDDEDFDPGYFRPQAFEAARRMLAKEEYIGAAGQIYSFHLSSLFGTEQRILEYLERWGTFGPQPLHDLAQHILVPIGPKVDLKLWADAVMQCGPEMAKMVKYADRLPAPARNADGRRFSVAATSALVAQHVYKNAAKNAALAAFCSQHSVEEKSFERALNLIERAPKQKNLPEITVDGKRFDMEGAVFRQLPANDPRGPFLGLLVDNCQHLDNAGRTCAAHGVESENGGFYVVEKDGEILGETWAWRGDNGELCFDSLETLGHRVNEEQWKKILTSCAEEITRDTRADKITAFHVGMGGATPRGLADAFTAASGMAHPRGYDGYSDACRAQIQVWKR